MARAVPSLDSYLDTWQGLHGGYDPRSSRVVGTWLRVVHACAVPFARAGASPDVVSLLGVLVSAAAVGLCVPGGRWVVLGAVVVGVSGLLDSLDGAVAVLTGRASAWGAVLDSVLDRLSDLAHVLALWVVGAPAPVCVAAAAVAFVQEYARARATAVGMDDIGVVTVGERPTRVIVVAAFLLAAGVYPGEAVTWAALGAWALVGVGAVAIVQLLVTVRRRLR